MNNNKRRRLLMSGVFLSLLGTVSASRVQLEPGFSTEAAVDMIHAKLYQTIPLPDKQNAEEGERKIAAWLEGVRKKPITRKQFCQLCDRAFNPRLSQVHRDRVAEAKHAILSKVAENFIVEFLRQRFLDTCPPSAAGLYALHAGCIESFRAITGGFELEFANITRGFREKSESLYSSTPMLPAGKVVSMTGLKGLMYSSRVFAAYEEIFALLVFLDALTAFMEMGGFAQGADISSWDFQRRLTMDNVKEEYRQGLHRVLSLIPKHQQWKVGQNVKEGDVKLRYARHMLNHDINVDLDGKTLDGQAARTDYILKLLKAAKCDERLKKMSLDIYIAAVENGDLDLVVDGELVTSISHHEGGVCIRFFDDALVNLASNDVMSQAACAVDVFDEVAEEGEQYDSVVADDSVVEDREGEAEVLETSRFYKEALMLVEKAEGKVRRAVIDQYYAKKRELRHTLRSAIEVTQNREARQRRQVVPPEVKADQGFLSNWMVKMFGVENLSLDLQRLVNERLLPDILAGRPPHDSVSSRRSLPQVVSVVVPKDVSVYEHVIANKPEVLRLYYYLEKERKVIVAWVAGHLR